MKYRFHLVVGILVTASLVLGCGAVAPTEVSPYSQGYLRASLDVSACCDSRS